MTLRLSRGALRLRQWMRHRGLRAVDMASKASTSVSTVNALRNGRRTPSLELAVVIQELTEDWEHGSIQPTEWRRFPTPAEMALVVVA